MAGSLEFIKSVEVTTSTSSVDVTDCFSADYDVYKIVWHNISTAGTVHTEIKLRFIDNLGSTISTANYDYAHLLMAPNTTF